MHRILNEYFIRIVINKIKQLKWLLFSIGKGQMDLGQQWYIKNIYKKQMRAFHDSKMVLIFEFKDGINVPCIKAYYQFNPQS